MTAARRLRQPLPLLALTAAMALVAADSVARAAWSPEMPQLHLVAVVAAVIGVGLAGLRWRWWMALPAALATGGVVIAAAAITMPSLAAHPWPLERLNALGARLGDWTADAVSGRVSTDTLPFGVAVAAALWLAVALGGYAYRRWCQPWLLAGLVGAVLAVNVSHLDRSFDWHFVAYAVLAGLAVADAHRGRVLARTGGNIVGRGMPGVSAALVAVVGLAGVAGAHALPRLDREAGWDGTVSAVTGRLDDLRGDVERLFGGVRPPTAPDELALGPALPLVGVRGGDDPIVAQVQLTGVEGDAFLRVAAFDVYTGHAWELGEVETRDAAVSPFRPQESAGGIELRVLVRSTTSVLLTLGDVQSVSVPARTVGADLGPLRVELDGRLPASLPQELQSGLQTARALAAAGHWGGETGSWWPDRYALALEEQDGLPMALLVSDRVTPPPDIAAWRAADPLNPGDTYILRSALPDSPDALRGADPTYPLAIERRYLALPPQSGSDAALDSILALIASESPLYGLSPYDRARAIEQWLCCSRLSDGRLRFPREDLSPAPPPATDAARWFLLERRDVLGRPAGGSAQLRATAMVALLRAAGVPSRLALGFPIEAADPDTVHTLWRHDASTWAEVYFPGAGWVPFDPTPGPEIPLYDLSAADGPALGGPALDELLRPFAPPPSPRPRTPAAPLPRARTAPAAAEGGGAWMAWLMWTGVALGAPATLAGATVVAWRLTLPGATPAERTWASLHRWAWLTGCGGAASLTPLEFAAVLEARTGRNGAVALANDYVRERFSARSAAVAAPARREAHTAIRTGLLRARLRGASL